MPKKPNIQPLTLLWVIIIGIILIWIGYWMALANTSPTPTNTQQTYVGRNRCNVQMALPNEPVSADGYSWNITGSASAAMISKLAIPNIYRDQVAAMYSIKDLGTDSISKAVVVNCANHASKYANNEELLADLRAQLDIYNSDTEIKDMQSQTYKIVSVTPTTRWGREVLDLVVEQYETTANYTMFVDSSFVYEISIMGQSKDPKLATDAMQIFDSIRFDQ